MKLRYGTFHTPDKVDIRNESGMMVFSWSPFEKGMGHTIGNGLRRILLSSIEAPAVIGISISGFLHEFMAIEGVREDMLNIVLQTKGILLRMHPSKDGEDVSLSKREYMLDTTLSITEEMIKANNGEYPVTAEQILSHDDFELMNPDHILFHVVKSTDLDIEFRIRIGRGYVPVDRLAVTDRREYEVLIDGRFSPVVQVALHVEPFRVGRDTNYDQLILKVKTDDRVKADEAVGYAAQILNKHCQLLDSLDYIPAIVFDEIKEEEQVDVADEELWRALSAPIENMDLPVRAFNCLRESGVAYVAELVLWAESDLLEVRNLGKKSLDEIKQKLLTKGLSLGMDLSQLGIDTNNVKEKIADNVQQKGLTKGVYNET